ncbi:MAG: HD domain-containing phosphohydrolase [Synechococcaceae cyanobacterium]|nr:HD domain-containing phosphohydrolase [Synechococcaceae cyanobacterium]
MSLYSRLIAMDLGIRLSLRSDFAADLYLFAALHDVGKVGIPDQILHKPRPLNAEERREMETHVHRGSELIEEMISGLQLVSEPLPSPTSTTPFHRSVPTNPPCPRRR